MHVDHILKYPQEANDMEKRVDPILFSTNQMNGIWSPRYFEVSLVSYADRLKISIHSHLVTLDEANHHFHHEWTKKLNSEITRSQSKFNADNFEHVKQIPHIFHDDTRELTWCCHNFPRAYMFATKVRHISFNNRRFRYSIDPLLGQITMWTIAVSFYQRHF